MNTEEIAVRIALALEAEGHVWAIKPEALSMLASLPMSTSIEVGALAELQAAQIQAASGPGAVDNQNGVAVLGLSGMLSPQVSLLSLIFGGGGSGLLGFRSQLRAAAADPDVKSIVLNIDSPGGYVDLIPETAADIRTAGNQKPVVAVANTLAASAAYWLAAQAHEIVVSPSAEVGSIGVYQVHMDKSEMLATMGVKPTIVRAGKYKIEGNPYTPLSQDGHDQMQEGVDDYYDMFTKDVALGRGVQVADVVGGYGEGRTLTARRAVRAGLADKVATLNDTISRLSSGRARVRRAAGNSELELPEGGDGNGSEASESETARLSAEQRGRLLDVVAGLNR